MSSDVAELELEVGGAQAGWRQVTLGKVVRIVTDGISAADLAALPEVHHYSLPAFDEGAGPEVGPGDTIKSNKTVVPDDCVLFSKLNPRIPRIWRVRGDAPSHSYCSTEFWPLVAQDSDVDLDYLTHYLSSAAFLGHPDITPSSSTNSHQRVDRKSFERFEFVLPPRDEQRRIAEVLRSVDEAIASTRTTLSFCEDFLIAQRRETFLHLIEEPGETSAAFKDMCDLGRGFAFKSEDYQDTGVLNFRVTNVGKPVDDLGGKCFLPEAFLDTFEEYVLHGDEIVLVMVGATVGKLGRVPEAVCPALLNQNMWILNAKPPFTHNLLWHFAHVLIEAKVHGAQGGAYSFLTKKDFLQHSVGRFDHDAMAERVSYLSSIEEYSQRLSEELRAAIAMKARLSADLLSGHVRVPA